jgi:DNA-binding MarR family transcriptional regulator
MEARATMRGSIGPDETKGKRRRRAARTSITELITAQWRRERSDLDLDDFLLAIYFMRLGTWLERAFDKMCVERWGVGGGDMRVMLALRRSGAPYVKRPTDLFRALLVTSGAITKKVDRLVEAGFVERLPDPGHSGGFLVHLTKKGLHAVNEATVTLANESMLAPATAELTKEEREAINRHVLRILSTLEEMEEPGHGRAV